MLKNDFLVIFLIIFISSTYSQDCFEYHQDHCFPKDSKYVYEENNSTVSFLFSSGEIRKMPFTLLLGKDYRIKLCADPVFEDIIEFIIINEDGKAIYNNSTQNFNLNLEFSCKKTQTVTLQLKAPDSNAGVSDTLSSEGCIGLLIEEMVSVKTGF